VEEWKGMAQAVFCISVLEHVADLDGFLDGLSRVVAPGGLLFLTFDMTFSVWDWADGKDHSHFNWMRVRLFTQETWLALAAALKVRGFELFGEADWSPVNPEMLENWGFTFGSLCMKRERAGSDLS